MFMESGLGIMDWDSLRRRARELESTLEVALPELSKLASSSTNSPHGDAQRLTTQIESSLSEFRECKEQMAGHVERSGTAATTAVLQRYREVLFDFDSEYKRVSSRLQRDRDRDALLGGAKRSKEGGDSEHMEPLLRERKSIGGALRGVADTIAQGVEARQMLAAQRATLEGSHLSIGGIISSMPSVDEIIVKLQNKKTRNNVILGTTVGCCVSFLLWAIIH
ncbi:hypothetical protein M885DRAFT_520176 [Pelagophyceae sp. CCMP2097]|nr:hypothetical protein M885DRAFT_520176 [Pelagophyceae sp. CCMP2097]